MTDMRHYYLVDLENVGIKALRGIDLAEKDEEVVIFISNAMHTATTELLEDILRSKAVVRTFFCGASSKNAMDFEIAAFFGEIIKRPRTERISIISSDKGYQALKDYGRRVRKTVQLYQAPTVMEALVAAKDNYPFREYECRKDNMIDFKQVMKEVAEKKEPKSRAGGWLRTRLQRCEVLLGMVESKDHADGEVSINESNEVIRCESKRSQ